MSRNKLYDVKFLVKCLMGLLGTIALMKVTGGAGFAVAFLLLFTCLSRNNSEILFYAFIMTIAITMGNNNIVVKSFVFSLLQRVFMLLLAGIMVFRIAGGRKSPLVTPFLSLLLYMFYMIVPSAQGWCPIISYLKIFLFVMVLVAYIGVANSVIISHRASAAKIRSAFLMMAVFFVFGSMALIPFPALSQLTWQQMQQILDSGGTVTSLFTGMTFHSQALGPLCAAIGVLLYADLLFSVRHIDRLYLALLACIPILIWKTSSRTAMGSFLAGVCFVTFFFMQSRGVRSSWKAKVMSSMTLIGIALSLSLVVIPVARDKAVGFILKFGHEDKRDVTFEEVTATRRGKWDSALYNFRKSPMIGNGFQVSEDFIGLKPSLMTMSAPVEKGVWITAVLEEGGVIGMILFLFFLMSVFGSLLKRRCYQGLAAFFMLILTNVGEFTIFSMTATGGLLWAIVFTGVILDACRQKEVMQPALSRLRNPWNMV